MKAKPRRLILIFIIVIFQTAIILLLNSSYGIEGVVRVTEILPAGSYFSDFIYFIYNLPMVFLVGYFLRDIIDNTYLVLRVNLKRIALKSTISMLFILFVLKLINMITLKALYQNKIIIDFIWVLSGLAVILSVSNLVILFVKSKYIVITEFIIFAGIYYLSKYTIIKILPVTNNHYMPFLNIFIIFICIILQCLTLQYRDFIRRN